MHPSSSSNYGGPPSRDPRERPPPPAGRPLPYLERSAVLDYSSDRDRDRERARDSYRDAHRDRDSYSSSRGRDWDPHGSRYQERDRPPHDAPSSSTAPQERARVPSGGSSHAPDSSRARRPSPAHSLPAHSTTFLPASRSGNPFREGPAASSSRVPESPGRTLARRKDSLGRGGGSDGGSGPRSNATSSTVSPRDKAPTSVPRAASSLAQRRGLMDRDGQESSQSLEPGEIPNIVELGAKHAALVGEYMKSMEGVKSAELSLKRSRNVLTTSDTVTDAMKAKVKEYEEGLKAAESKRDALGSRCGSLLQRIVDAAHAEKQRGIVPDQSDVGTRLARQLKDQIEREFAKRDKEAEAKAKEKEKESAASAAAPPSVPRAPPATAPADVEMGPPQASDARRSSLPSATEGSSQAASDRQAKRKRNRDALGRLEKVEIDLDDLRLYLDEHLDGIHEFIRPRLRLGKAGQRREGSRVGEEDGEREAKRAKEDAGVEVPPPPSAAQAEASDARSAQPADAQASTATQAADPAEDDVVFTGSNPAPTPTPDPSMAASAPSTTVAGAQTTAHPVVTEPQTPAPPAGPSPEVVALQRQVEEMQAAQAAAGHQMQAIISGLMAREAASSQRMAEMELQLNGALKHLKVDRVYLEGIVSLLKNVPEPPVVGPNNQLVPAEALAASNSAPRQGAAAGPSNASNHSMTPAPMPSPTNGVNGFAQNGQGAGQSSSSSYQPAR